MTRIGMIAVATVLLCFLLGLFPVPSACSYMGRSCCTRYSRKPVPFQRIKGYREQTSMEHCHIDAIIFYTVKKNVICASQKDEWVRRTLNLLSTRLKNMSKTSSGKGETQRKSMTSEESGPVFRPTETFSNTTENIY